jgi:uncharacterized membrane protein HdeD (DUF308 family)
MDSAIALSVPPIYKRRDKMKLPKKLSVILLAVYLILAGLVAFGLKIPWVNYIMGSIAIVAGVFFFIDK